MKETLLGKDLPGGRTFPHSFPSASVCLAAAACQGLNTAVATRRPFVNARALALLAGLALLTAGPASAQPETGLPYAFSIRAGGDLDNGFSLVAGTLSVPTIVTKSVNPAITLVFDMLSQNTQLINANGTTADGQPFISLPANTQRVSGKPLALYLSFRLPRAEALAKGVSFTLRQTDFRPPTKPSSASILGADLNGDGVRDDLEPTIQARYRHQPKILAAAMQQLRAMQMGLVATRNAGQAFDAVLVLNRSIDCMIQVAGLEAGAKEVAFLRDSSLDSKERVLAWIKTNGLLAGKIAPGTEHTPCDK